MKNQLDLILSISAFVVGAIFVIVSMTTAPQPQPLPSAPTVDTSPPKLPEVNVVMANSLPGGNKSGAGAGARGGSGKAGGKKGFGPQKGRM